MSKTKTDGTSFENVSYTIKGLAVNIDPVTSTG